MMGILGEIAKLYAADPIPCGAMLAAASSELERLDEMPPNPETATRLPVCAHLSAAIASAQGGRLAAIADQFERWETGARWRQNPNYTVDTMGPNFMANYGYAELVGHDRPWESAAIAVGFLLLGPGAHYSMHHHPAAEVYHVVSGVAEWRQGSGAPATKPVGAAIYHAPKVKHETRVLGEPCLALYCWTGDIRIPARLS